MTQLSTTVNHARGEGAMERLRAKTSAVIRRADRYLSVNTASKLLALLVLFIGPQAVMAIAAPAAGTFGYDIYDLMVNDILNGAIGFVGGVLVIVWGASKLMQSWMIALLTIVAGSIIIEADTVVTSLGAMI